MFLTIETALTPLTVLLTAPTWAHMEQAIAPLAGMSDLVEPDAKLGPAMKMLSPRARAFVLALVELGGNPQERAAAMAGYGGNKAVREVTASRLAADPRVQAAIVEEAKALARSASLTAIAETIKILTGVTPAAAQVRLNAASRIMTLAGMEPDKNVNVNHMVDVAPSAKQQIAEVIRLSKDVGIDPRKLLGKAGVIVDAEFQVVGDKTGLEDLL